MADAYDMRSNLKNKPDAQGTLFKVKDKGLLNPQQRWPQGYTPDRLNEVREGLKAVPVSAPDHFYEQPSDETQKMYGFNEYGTREKVTREIAKTTIPGEHLKGLTGIHGDPDDNTHGTYWKGSGRREIGVDMTGETGLDPHEQRKTLVHEIGHHVNMTLAPTPHVTKLVAQLHATKEATQQYEEGERPHWEPTATDVAMKFSRVKDGVGEAQADDYAVEHFRTGGRKSKGTTTGAYEDTFTTHERKKNYPGYNDVRPPQPSGSQRVMQPNQFNEQNQPAMISKLTVERDQERAGNRTPLQRRLAAQKDATRQALGG